MTMLDSFKQKAGWKRKRTSKKDQSDPLNRPIVSVPILNPSKPSTNAASKRKTFAEPYRVPYAVPYPVLAEKKSPSVRRRLTVYFKKDNVQPTVSISVVGIPTPPSSTKSAYPASPRSAYPASPITPTYSNMPLSPAFSSRSGKSLLSSSSQDSSMLLRHQSSRVPTKRKSIKMPTRSKSLRRASGDLLSVYTFLGGQESISADPKNRRASRFYMDTQYQSLASPGVPKVPTWATAK